MTIHRDTSNAVGFVIFAVATIWGGLQAAAAKLFAQTPGESSGANSGLQVTIGIAVIGLLTQVVTGIFNGQKVKREVAEKLAVAEAAAIEAKAQAKRDSDDAKSLALREVADAKAEAARLVADAKAESDRQHAAADLERLKWANSVEMSAARAKIARDYEQDIVLKLQNEVRELRRADRRTTPQVDRNTQAIDAIADQTHIEVPPNPEPPA